MNNRRFTFLSVIALLIFAFTSCHDSEVLQRVPSHVSQFIEQYWPGTEIISFSNDVDKGCTVTVKNGPTVSFDSSQAWTDIKGNGSPLPSVLLYDRLPEPLYDYIVEMEATDGVYGVSRTSTEYKVVFLDSEVAYDIATGKISYLTPGKTE